MPSCGIGLGLPYAGTGIDPDALAYFARAGIASGTQTPTSYDNAASFNGSSQFLQTTASNISIASGESFSFAGWVSTTAATGRLNLLSLTNGTETISLYLDQGVQILVFRARTTTGPVDLAPSSSTSSVPAGASIFVHGQYDANLQKCAVSVNNSVFTYSTGTGTPISSLSSPIQLNGSGPIGGASFFAGTMAGFGFWKKALSASEVTQLWNSGAGRTYASLDSGLRTNLISWWALNQNSVTADSHGTNTLTNSTPAVTAPNIGPIVTSLTDSRRLISDFVRGIKSLGLWNSMVCWPLRASQNASTTLTARSLGGLGRFDGTLVGLSASAWAANGLAISNPSVGSNSQRVDLPTGIGTGGANIYSYGAGLITSSANFNRIIQIENAAANTRNPFTSYGYLGGAQQFLQVDLMSGSNTQVSALQNNATIPLNTYGSMSAGVVGNTLTAYNNTTAGPTATSPGGWSAPPGETTRSLGVSYNGTLSMVVLGRFEASATLVENLNNLYKQTLLLGLGLP